MNLGRIAATTVAQLKMMFRRRITLFWSLLFPMILMTLLGLLFGQSIDAGTITVINNAGRPPPPAWWRRSSTRTASSSSRTRAAWPTPRTRCRTATRDALLVLTQGRA